MWNSLYKRFLRLSHVAKHWKQFNKLWFIMQNATLKWCTTVLTVTGNCIYHFPLSWFQKAKLQLCIYHLHLYWSWLKGPCDFYGLESPNIWMTHMHQVFIGGSAPLEGWHLIPGRPTDCQHAIVSEHFIRGDLCRNTDKDTLIISLKVIFEM